MSNLSTKAPMPHFRIPAVLALATLSALGLTAKPATAQAISPVTTIASVGNNFLAAGYGQNGYINFDSITNPSPGGNYHTATANQETVLQDGNTVIVQPSYVSALSTPGSPQSVFGGYGYVEILPGKEAGLGGPGAAGGNLLSFTVGANAPAVIQFGVLGNYSNAGDNATNITLTGPTNTVTVTGNGVVSTGGYDYLFSITGAKTGNVYTVSLPAQGSGNGALVSGVTFDPGVVPEPSSVASLVLGILCIGLLAFKARRRSLTN